MWQAVTVLLVTVLWTPIVRSVGRTCCRYNEDATFCESKNSCVVLNNSVKTGAPDSQCSVSYDTKFDKSQSSSFERKKSCLAKKYKSKRSFFLHMDYLPFYIHTYPFTQLIKGRPHFTGMDLRYQYNLFDMLRFRIKNMNPKVCPNKINEGSICNPRCVEIDKSARTPALGVTDNLAYLSYDCEIGFFTSKTSTFPIQTTFDPYELSVCAWEDKNELDDAMCGEYMFQLPPAEEVDTVSENHQVLLLIDKHEYENNDLIVVYIPTSHTKADKYIVSIMYVVGENNSRSSIYNQSESIPDGVGKTLKVILDHQIPSGRYQISVTPLRGGLAISDPSYSCYLTKPDYGQHALGIITAILVIIVIVGVFLTVYKRWQQVAEEGAVEPSQLVETGRIEPKSVLIVTALSNPDHVEVVKDLCRYLRDWCGVGTTYFALDEDTGIQSGSGQADPWKWCQETGDVVRQNGVVVFIAGPDPALAARTSIHPNLERNQAFLTTSHLKAMADQGRAIVLKFSYSDMSTIPTEVPQHLKDKAYHLPKHMNNFLCHLLQVKKRDLCSLVPVRVVRPEIIPHDLTKPGGPELLEKIRELCLKEHKHRLEQAQQRHSTPIDRLLWNKDRPSREVKTTLTGGNEGCASDSEDRPLYPTTHTNSKPNKAEDIQSTLKVELEEGMPSTRTMENRDKTVLEQV